MTVNEASRMGAASADRAPEIIESGGTARLHLTLATTDYDHVRDLMNGVVRAEGIVLTGFVLPVEEIFFRFIKNREWDISEMSFGKFIAFSAQANSPFIGIPVFPSRVFRHSAFYVRADRGIAAPKDLEGKTVGIPEWAQTAGIYARGFLAESAGVDLRKIKWVQAGMNEAGREEKVEFTLPKGIQYQQRRDSSLSAMLLSGEIDAAISARVPDAFNRGGGNIVRLYPDYRGEEMRYYDATGIFPIMHVIAMRRAVFERYPWVAMNMFKAFDAGEGAQPRTHRRSHGVAHSGAVGGRDCRRMEPELRRRSVSLRTGSQPQDARRVLPFRPRPGRHRARLTPDDLFPKEVRASVRV